MIKKLLIAICLFLAMTFTRLSAQRLISDSLLAHYDKIQTDSIFTANGIPITSASGISCYRLIYETLNARRTDTTFASGLLIVPDQIIDAVTCPYPIAMYDHGTVLYRYDVPSWLNSESLIAMLLAGQGYFTLAPDYLGMGVSPGFHPYIHAHSEAQAGIDLILASKDFASRNSIPLSDQLFLTGYSQGGHACMATHKYIQSDYAGILNVTASAPGSGPYNLSGIQASGLANDSFYADPAYIPYLVFAYQSVYGNLYDSVPQFLQHPWDSILPPLYGEQFETDTIDGLMPHHVDSFVVISQLNRYTTDSANDPLRIDLRDNDVYNWKPTSPIQMTYCTADEQVIYQSSIFTYNYFRAEGDSQVTLINGGNLDHLGCVTPAVTNMIGFFSHYVVHENNLHLTFTTDSATTIGGRTASVKVSVSGGTGYTILWSNGSNDSVLTGLANGSYTVTVTDVNGCTKVRSINTGGITTAINELSNYTPDLQIFPNPTSTQLFLRVDNFRPSTITVYNVNGQKIREEAYLQQMDVSSLSTGIYTIEVKNAKVAKRSLFVKL